MATAMPTRGERSAPTFDKTQPRSLKRYFEDLETLFARHNVQTDDAKRKWVRSYVEIDVADFWDLLPSATAAGKTYDDYKKEIFDLYPGASDAKRWTRQDLADLIMRQFHQGIRSIEDWSQFYREYYVITTYLIQQGRFSSDDQGRKVLDVLSPALLEKVSMRLQIKVSTHDADAAYALSEINEAVTWVLNGGGAIGALAPVLPAVPSQPTTAPVAATAPATDSGVVKQEDLKAIIEAFAKIADGFSRGATGGSRPFNSGGGFMSSSCHYCGQPGHNIPSCPSVEEDLQAGLCRRNAEGKIVLPSGGWIPRSMPGNNMRERLRAWHQSNPNNVATGSLSYSNNMQTMMLDAIEVDEEGDKIRILEQEIQRIKRRREAFDGVELPQPPHKHRVATDSAQQPVAGPSNSTATESVDKGKGREVPAPAAAPIHESPEHPFRNVADGVRMPRGVPNFIPDPNVRIRAPIESEEITAGVFSRFMKQQSINLTTEELLAISPEMRTRTRIAVTGRRPGAPAPTRTAMEQEIVEEDVSEPSQAAQPGVYVLSRDVFAAQFGTNVPQENVRVAPESESLRTVVAIVDKRESVECILDPGCQIVAMSERTAIKVGVPWDPTIVLNMQSANGQVNRSLGLARNVPFQFAGITIYMQVHIIRQAAYDVLLGRPFDEITRSVVSNLSGG